MSGGLPIADPLRLTPVLVPKPWGGRRLARWNQKLPPGERIGESWVVADLDPAVVSSVGDPVTRVADGPLQGRSLRELIAMDADALLGRADDLDGRFPLLVKLLDARQHLSVQLHPHAAYAAEDPSVAVKTESWVVLEAEPDSQLMLGLADGVRQEDLLEALGTPDVASLLRRVPAVPGEMHHLPAGLVHALGAGVVVAEVQTPSDTTFRLYDWTTEYDRPSREIHRGPVARCLELELVESRDVEVEASSGLVRTPLYTIERCDLPAGGSFRPEPGAARVLIVVDGTVRVAGISYAPGEVVLLPGSWSGPVTAAEAASLLNVEPASSAR
jgi:mannose-6-phosphate isomerase